MKKDRRFEIRTITMDNYMVVLMDLETYNEALANHIEHLKDECFNNGFEAGQCPYPTEEEIEEMEKEE